MMQWVDILNPKKRKTSIVYYTRGTLMCSYDSWRKQMLQSEHFNINIETFKVHSLNCGGLIISF